VSNIFNSDLSYTDLSDTPTPFYKAWGSKTPMPTARDGPTGGFEGGKFYAIGGNDGANRIATVEMGQ